MSAFAFLASKRKTRENHMALQLLTLGSSGDGKAVTKLLDEWEKDAD